MTINEIVSAIEAKHRQEGIIVKDPASAAEIQYFEKQIGFQLPYDFREFYFTCNGFECTEDIFNMLSLNDILEDNYHYGKGWFHFSEYMIFSDMWSLRKNSDNSYEIYNQEEIDLILTSSLRAFLLRFLQGNVFRQGGLYDWQEEIRKGLGQPNV